MKKIIYFFAAVSVILTACNNSKKKSDKVELIVPETIAPPRTTDTISLRDIDGNGYHTIAIGKQLWMVENLKVTHYRNGDVIPEVTDGEKWSMLKTGAYVYYDHKKSNTETYGHLYNWFAVKDKRNICPKGWHVPSDNEWTILRDYLGGETVSGGKMKETGTAHWKDPNIGADNSSGFTAVPGGFCNELGYFQFMGKSSIIWSATEDDAEYAFYRALRNVDSEDARLSIRKVCGCAVRCVKD